MQSIFGSFWLFRGAVAATFSIKSERIFKLMKSFVNNLYDSVYTREQAKNNDEESGDDEEIDIKRGERKK